jgi:secreted Zn-dependent insulinase-like peptidase
MLDGEDLQDVRSFPPEFLGKLVKFKTVGNVKQMHLIFPIAMNKIAYCPYVKPLEYTGAIFNDRSKGSLYYELMQKGYISDLLAGVIDASEDSI